MPCLNIKIQIVTNTILFTEAEEAGWATVDFQWLEHLSDHEY